MVEVIHYTPAYYPPGVKDKLGTEALFQAMLGKRYRIAGFDEYGHIELRPTRTDWVWIHAQDLKLISGKSKGRKRLRPRGSKSK